MGPLDLRDEDPAHALRGADAGPWPKTDRMADLGGDVFSRHLWNQGWPLDHRERRKRTSLGAPGWNDRGQQRTWRRTHHAPAIDVLPVSNDDAQDPALRPFGQHDQHGLRGARYTIARCSV